LKGQWNPEKIHGKDNQYFMYISDGECSHSTSEIKQMLEIKFQIIESGYVFVYVSTLIDGSSSSLMEQINKDLGGTSHFVDIVLRLAQSSGSSKM